MQTPTVSIMLPCFNARETLPIALASVRAQTLQDWECVCIDDGSMDGTGELLQAEAEREPRIRVERFAQNRGRGAARQRALELARGEYLAFLDSDDWMYPDRLQHEAEWLHADNTIAAVSVCAAVTKGADELIGVMRHAGTQPLPTVAAFDKPVPPPILFPPSMIRTSIAKQTGFDPAFRRSQDSDFLIRALLGRRYALSERVLYAYSQGSAASLARTLEGYRYRMRAHARHWKRYPIRVARTIVDTAAKMIAYRVAGALGQDNKLIARRWRDANGAVERDFFAALEIVKRHVRTA